MNDQSTLIRADQVKPGMRLFNPIITVTAVEKAGPKRTRVTWHSDAFTATIEAPPYKRRAGQPSTEQHYVPELTRTQVFPDDWELPVLEEVTS